MKKFLAWISKKEGAHSRTEQLERTTQKMWVIQFVNTALIILMLNTSFKKDSLIDKGQKLFLTNSVTNKIALFSADWYGFVGVTIVVTCFLSTIHPFMKFFQMLYKGTKRCFDRGCSCDKRRTRQVT